MSADWMVPPDELAEPDAETCDAFDRLAVQRAVEEYEWDRRNGGQDDDWVREPQDEGPAPVGHNGVGEYPHRATPPDERPWPVFDRTALYGLTGEVVETIEPETEGDPAGLCANFLALFGASAGRGPHAMADGGQHPARLFVVVVGQSAKARKSATFNHPREVIRVADHNLIRDRVHGGFGSGEAMVDTIADGDDHRMILVEPEYSQILDVATRKNAILSRIIRCAWDGEPLIVNSRAAKSRADDAHLVVLGAITADELRSKLTSTEAANGFGNRHLYVCVRRARRLPHGGNLDRQVVHELGRKTRDRLERARRIGILRRSPEADERWAELYHQMCDDEPSGLLGAVTGRDQGQVLRLSVAYALTDASNTIELAHLEAAWAMWSYCRASAAYIFGGILGNEMADKLLAALRQAGGEGLDGTAQRDVFNQHITREELEATRQFLGRHGLAVTHNEARTGRGGRPGVRSWAKGFQP